jgi:hypothetical protein
MIPEGLGRALTAEREQVEGTPVIRISPMPLVCGGRIRCRGLDDILSSLIRPVIVWGWR